MPSSCSSTITQVTDSAGGLVEEKGGGLVFTQAASSAPDSSQNGSVVAMVSNADLTGDNPNFLDQVFVAAGGGFERITAMTGGHVGSPALTRNGRFVTFESDGDLTPAALATATATSRSSASTAPPPRWCR